MEDARRKFMRQMANAAMGTAVAPLGAFYASGASAADCEAGGARIRGFGRITPQLPTNSDELGDIVSGNYANRAFLAIPQGFSYTILSGIGQTMGDGNRVPGEMDGMAAFQPVSKRKRPNGDPIYRPTVHLIRNHELEPGDTPFGETEGVSYAKPWAKYDREIKAGGVTTLVLDSRTKKVKREYVSLAGTLRNCGGGKTPWNSWISCEEDIRNQLDNPDIVSQPHGFAFEVPAFGPRRPVRPIPLTAMGRFRREAIAVDPRTTWILQTEDRSDSCFYGFSPIRKVRKAGQLRRGGKLYAMAIRGNQRATCDGSRLPTKVVQGKRVVDTSKGMQPFIGQSLKVDWVELEEPNPPKDSLRYDAQKLGASIFNRGEGMIFDDRRRIAYFTATHGGDAGTGQIWAYHMRTRTVKLVLESDKRTFLDSPDNIVLGPDGTLYICEDSSRRSHIVGMRPSGKTFRVVRNVINRGELAGVCFSPDGKLMFVNIQDISVTCCIYRDDGKKISL